MTATQTTSSVNSPTPQYSDLLVAKRCSILKGQRRARLDRALDAAGPWIASTTRVLDLGCADGILWPDLMGRVHSIVGVNYDDWHTQQCRQRFPDGIVMRADARRLPFGSASFDLVLCLEMFHYLDPDARHEGIKELHRVLRPGGRLVLTVPIEVGLPGAVKFAVRVATRGCWPSPGAHLHMLWRRILYPFVGMRESARRTVFHFNAYELRKGIRQVFGDAKLTRAPYFYPLVTTAVITADKPR